MDPALGIAAIATVIALLAAIYARDSRDVARMALESDRHRLTARVSPFEFGPGIHGASIHVANSGKRDIAVGWLHVTVAYVWAPPIAAL